MSGKLSDYISKNDNLFVQETRFNFFL